MSNTFIEKNEQFSPIIYHPEFCIQCNQCVEVCQVDVLHPCGENKTPSVVYPDECWYCGCCVMACPVKGAIEFKHPMMNQVSWINKPKKRG